MRTPSEVAAKLHKRSIRPHHNQLVVPPTAATLPPGVKGHTLVEEGRVTAATEVKNVDDSAAVANPHKVPQAQWRKWNGYARRAFNSLYSFMVNNQSLLVHPQAAPVDPKHWKTTAWNASWTAADAAMGIYFGDEMGTAESDLTKTRTSGKRNDAPKPKKKPPVNPRAAKSSTKIVDKAISTKAKAGRLKRRA